MPAAAALSSRSRSILSTSTTRSRPRAGSVPDGFTTGHGNLSIFRRSGAQRHVAAAGWPRRRWLIRNVCNNTNMANLARDIRTAGESNDLRDPFDLAGFNQPRLEQLVRSALQPCEVVAFCNALAASRWQDQPRAGGADRAEKETLSCAQVNESFGEPIPVRQMVRFSFLVGGGQKMRQKYDADCSKHMATALRAIGYHFPTLVTANCP